MKGCSNCNTTSTLTKKPKYVKPILSEDFGQRGQIDLIDLSGIPDDGYKYVGVYQDHISKFCVLFSLKSKSAEEVGLKLITGKHIFEIE